MRRHAKAATAGSSKERRTDGSGRVGAGARAALLACVLVGLLAALAPAAASAAITHHPEPFSPLTGSGSGLTLGEPQGVAIDEATGNVFVTDGATSVSPGHERVAILGGEGGVPAGLTSPYEIPGFSFGENTSNGLAYDNSPTSPAQGTLYVTDQSSATVKKYTRNAVSEKYEPAGEIAVPNGTTRATLSVDSDGDLYVSAKSTIYKFGPSGTQLAEYNFGGFNNPLAGPGQVAVDSAGDLFVVDFGSGLYKFPADGSGEIDPTVFTQITSDFTRGVTIDPSIDHVFVALEKRVVEYDAAGNKIDEFGAEEIGRNGQVAFDSESERIYVADASHHTGGHEDVNVFGPAVTVPTTGIGAATNVTGTKATLNGSVNPEGIAVTECFFEWGEDLNGEPNYEHEAPCEALPPTDSASHPVSANISGLIANGKAYHFRLIAKNENGTEKSADKTFVTANTVATEAATGVGAEAATLNGTLRPEGLQFTSCVFEYGLATSAGFEHSTSCNPSAAEVEADFLLHPVSAALTGLKTNAAYKFRLTATNSEGTLSGEVLTFTTPGPPQISQLRASFADQSSATLEAKINPRGFGTSYRFEWGPTSSYGNSVPVEFEPFLGAGEVPVQVRAKLSGLSAGTTYHYRVVAANSVDVSESPDSTLETLNSCGLSEGRCFELVSPQDPGPVGIPGQFAAATEIHFQAAPEPGSLAYVIENGLPDATTGAEVLYHGTRSSSGWSSTQLSAPITDRSETISANSFSGVTYGLSADLSCGVVASTQPLTDDASTELVREAGGSNLYRRNPDGSYTAISKLAPENLDAGDGFIFDEYALVAMSDDCSKVIFASKYRYPGVPSVPNVAGIRLYEWDEGTLRSLTYVPGPSGETLVELTFAFSSGGGGSFKENTINVVSADGSRVFFRTKRQTSANPQEVGKEGVFVREDGTTTRDLSLSETSTPDEGATYQWATKDGSRVFFTANAGLTDESSPEGTDLYEYDLDSDTLTDLSVDHEAGGAQVAGFIGGSEDGSHVYFIAQGRLVPGKGKTLAQNKNDPQNSNDDTYSIYGAEGGALSYVATIGEADLQATRVEFQGLRASRVSSDGRYLLFESSANVTGYESGGSPEAYLYDDAASSSDATVCVSCRQDGRESVEPVSNSLLARGLEGNPLYAPRSLIVRDGRPRVFFESFDKLAAGAAEGEGNVYEWSHGQVFRIATEPPGINSENGASEEQKARFFDASADGTDLYFATPTSLSWEDKDGRVSVYDARIGGGFPEPPAPPEPCEPKSEGSCEGATSPAPASTPTPSSSTFNGPGNAKAKAQQHKKRHKRHHRKRKARHAKHQRHANANRRAGK